MAKKFKLRYLIISLILIAVIFSCTAFSVSYASWVGSNTQLSASAGIGSWKEDNEEIKGNYVELNGNKVQLPENFLGGNTGYFYITFYVSQGATLKLTFENELIVANNIYASGVSQKGGQFSFKNAGLYQLTIIGSDQKTYNLNTAYDYSIANTSYFDFRTEPIKFYLLISINQHTEYVWQNGKWVENTPNV